MLQAGGHSHVAQGFRGYGAQEVGVCRRKGERMSETYLTRGGPPGMSSPPAYLFWPGLGAALPPTTCGRKAGQPRGWPLEDQAGRQAPVQGVASFSSHPSQLLPLGQAWPCSLGEVHRPQFLSGLTLPWASGRHLLRPPVQSCGSLLPLAAPLPGSQGPAPQPEGGGPSSLCSPGGIPEMFLVR